MTIKASKNITQKECSTRSSNVLQEFFLFENITYLQCVTKRQCQSVPLQKHQISDIRVTIAQMQLINGSISK